MRSDYMLFILYIYEEKWWKRFGRRKERRGQGGLEEGQRRRQGGLEDGKREGKIEGG